MKYCGIDPSFSNTAVVLIEGKKIEIDLKTFNYEKDYSHLGKLDTYFEAVFDSADYFTLEGYSLGSKGQGVSKMYEIGAIIRNKAYTLRKPVFIIAPQNLKKFVGVSQKDEVRLGVYKLWGFEHKSNDAVDAFALAQYCKALVEKTELKAFQREAIKSWQKNKDGIEITKAPLIKL